MPTMPGVVASSEASEATPWPIELATVFVTVLVIVIVLTRTENLRDRQP